VKAPGNEKTTTVLLLNISSLLRDIHALSLNIGKVTAGIC
jgi:hypothetical protein